MKRILRLLTFFALFLGVPNLFGAFQVKIAVYQNHDTLMSCVSKIGREKYRKNILIEEKNQLHYVTSTLYEKEKDAKKALLAYQKVFADAFIMEVEQKKAVATPSKTTLQSPEPMQKDVEEKTIVAKGVPQEALSEEAPSTQIVVSKPEAVQDEQVQETNISERLKEETIEEVPLLDAKMLLENKTVYICEEERVSRRNSTIIRMEFKKEYVVYTKQKKGTFPLNIAYSFDQDRLILPMSGVDFQYKLYREEKDFLLVQGFINGKKSKIFRYYFDKEAALSFVAGNQ